jgi:AraC-like DNA-binding protein
MGCSKEVLKLERESELSKYEYDELICLVKKLRFSKAAALEFYDLRTHNGTGGGEHKGLNYFRLDFAKRGRFECEFPDHTFSYRGENEITVMSTCQNEKWILGSNFPSGFYKGFAFVVKLDLLSKDDTSLLRYFGFDIFDLIEAMSQNQKWNKLITDERTLECCNCIYDDLHSGSDYNINLIKLRLLEVLIYVSKLCSTNNISRKVVYFSGTQVRKVKKIHDQLLSDLVSSFSLEDIVKANDIGYSTFNKIFKSVYGDSPYRYLKKHKMNLAAKMLLETDLNVTEIALAFGYNNPSKFASAFRDMTGMLPIEYRNKKTEWSV